MSKLLEALTIFLKYDNPSRPTHCSHEMMCVMIDPAIVSDKDKAKLDKLGFFVGTEYPDVFCSFRYGSA
jgi:hypothetical protein